MLKMIDKDKFIFKYILRQEITYLLLSLLLALVSYLGHDIQVAGRVFLHTALLFQLVIIITGWDVIRKRDD